MSDHDAIIRLEAAVEGLRQTVDVTSAAQAERHGRLEGKIDKINGTVAAHDDDLRMLKARPFMPISSEEAEEQVVQHRELWTVYKIGKWVFGAIAVALLGQTVALVLLVVNFTQGG